jgi:hypothetical protein
LRRLGQRRRFEALDDGGPNRHDTSQYAHSNCLRAAIAASKVGHTLE